MCAAIGLDDKLRFVAIEPSAESILALYEFIVGLPEGDLLRFRGYGIVLNEQEDCRFGACARDDEQGSGLAAALVPPTFEVARRFGKRRLILWGGVFAENTRAMRFHRKHGFREVGCFTDSDGKMCPDMLCCLADDTKIT
jgi:diamine N-acetyltransferase